MKICTETIKTIESMEDILFPGRYIIITNCIVCIYKANCPQIQYRNGK